METIFIILFGVSACVFSYIVGYIDGWGKGLLHKSTRTARIYHDKPNMEAVGIGGLPSAQAHINMSKDNKGKSHIVDVEV